MSSSPLSVPQAVSSFILWLTPRSAPKTVSWYLPYLNRFAKHCKDKSIADVRRLDVESFDARRHPLVAVCRFLKWCWEVAEMIPSNPAARVRAGKNGRRLRVLVRPERVMILRECRKELRRASLAMAESGMRPQEARAAAWEMIRSNGKGKDIAADLRAGLCFFQFDKFKSQERRANRDVPRVVPISPRLARLLARFRHGLRRPSGVIFKGRKGKAWTLNAMRCAYARLRRRLHRLGRVHVKGIVAYAWRHAFGTNAHRRGISSLALRDLMGHAGLKTTAVYVHAVADDVMRAAAALWDRQAKK